MDGEERHATALVRKLYNERPFLCDVEIHCPSEKSANEVEKLYAHQAILAAKNAYFWKFFERQSIPCGSSDSLAFHQPTPRTSAYNSSSTSGSSCLQETVPTRTSEPFKVGKRLSPVSFRDSASLMRLIIEFMYLGQLECLEAIEGSILDDNTFNKITRLFTWSVKHAAQQLTDYIVAHFLRLSLSPAQVGRQLEVALEMSDALIPSADSGVPTSSTPSQSSAGPVTASGLQQQRQQQQQQLRTLREQWIALFSSLTFSDEIFLPLTRNGLIVVLQEAAFDVPEIDVICAVRRWTEESAWVQSTYGGRPMDTGHVHALMMFVDPTCLSPPEFALVDSLFLVDIQERVYDTFLRNEAVLERGRIGESDRCLNRRALLPPPPPAAPPASSRTPTAALPADTPRHQAHPGAANDHTAPAGAGFDAPSEPVGSPRRTASVPVPAATTPPHPPTAAPPAANLPWWQRIRRGPSLIASHATTATAPEGGISQRSDGGSTRPAVWTSWSHSNSMDSSKERISDATSSLEVARAAAADTGVIVPAAELSLNLTTAQSLEELHRRAHADAASPESVFVRGSHFVITRMAERQYLLSVDSVSYQGVAYRGSVLRGVMRWRYKIIRNCDMFWFGVTANVSRDMSSFIAFDSCAWMLSDEAFCLEHCRDKTIGAGERMSRRIIVIEQQYFHVGPLCGKVFEDVEMRLDTCAGNLFCRVNGGEERHLFKNLPTQERLYPCMMATNKGQAIFTLLEAHMVPEGGA